MFLQGLRWSQRKIYTDDLDGDYKEAYTPFLNNLISNEIKKKTKKQKKKLQIKKLLQKTKY